MIHYELLLIYALGFEPKEVVKQFGYSPGVAYRFYRIFRLARERAVSSLTRGNHVLRGGKYKANNQDQGRKRIATPPREKRKVGRPKRKKEKCWVRNAETGEMDEVWL